MTEICGRTMYRYFRDSLYIKFGLNVRYLTLNIAGLFIGGHSIFAISDSKIV